MLIQPITVSPWQSNCYLVRASEDATDVVIVDPGVTAAEPVTAAVEMATLTTQVRLSGQLSYGEAAPLPAADDHRPARRR